MCRGGVGFETSSAAGMGRSAGCKFDTTRLKWGERSRGWQLEFAGDVGKAARGVPKADDFQTLILQIRSVDDAIGAANHFPQI